MKKGGFKEVKRVEKIISILTKFGFGYLIDKRLKFNKTNLKPERRLLLTLEKLGPTFIKLGQMLSVRPDLIPANYVKELGKLQDEVPSFPYEEAKEIIEKELRKPLNDIFSRFDKKPIASASIAQVHKAKLKNGDVVVIKVQRPDIKNIMLEDIELMKHLAKILERHSERLRKYKPTRIIEEFESWTKQEIDFKKEAENAKLFYKNFKNSATVKIPEVYDKLTTNKVLTLEFIDGIELHKIKELKKAKYPIKKAIINGFNAILTQIFEHGFFHGDPHPSNILVLKDGSIVFVDFGIVGKFSNKLKKQCIDLFMGVIEDDVDLIYKTLIKIGIKNKKIDEKEFKSKIEDIVSKLDGAKIKDIKISKILEEVLNLALDYDFKMPLSFILFGKSIVTLEGLALEYDPSFVIVDHARPFLERLIKKNYNFDIMANDFIRTLRKYNKFLKKLPDRTDRVLKTLEEGRVKVDIEDTDVKTLSLEIDRSSNRIAYGMIIAALIVAGALVINVNMPKLFEVPILSLLLFVAAGIVTLILIKSVLNEKNMKWGEIMNKKKIVKKTAKVGIKAAKGAVKLLLKIGILTAKEGKKAAKKIISKSKPAKKKSKKKKS